MDLTDAVEFCLDLLADGDLFRDMPGKQIAADLRRHPELFAELDITTHQLKHAMSIHTGDPAVQEFNLLCLSVELSGVDDLAAVEVMKGWNAPVVKGGEVEGTVVMTLQWPTDEASRKLAAFAEAML